MRSNKNSFRFLPITGLRLTLCLAGAGLFVSGQARTLTVLAAASLREACTQMARAFESSHPGDHVRITFAGSQQLAAQILLNAPADVFLSADETQMRRVLAARKATRSYPFCSNSLVIAVRPAFAKQIKSLEDLGGPGLRLAFCKAQVPAGEYAEKILNKLPPDTANKIRGNIRSRETDVRTVLARVEMGEADAGIVYATDIAAGRGRVAGVSIPVKFQTPVQYVVAVLSGTKEPGLAESFLQLTLGRAGQTILRQQGFLPATHQKT